MGLSGIKAGGGVKAGQAGIMEGVAISTAELEACIVGMFGSRTFGVEVSGPAGKSPLSEGTGISGACLGPSELGVSRIESAQTSTESLFDFLKPRKPFFVVPLGGGAAGTSSALPIFLFLLFFCFWSNESSSSFSLLPFVDLSLSFFSFASFFSFLVLVSNKGFLLSTLSSLKTTFGAIGVLPSRVWWMDVSREGRAPAGRQ